MLLLGANGSGKSTLMRLMGGLYLPDAGQLRVDGLDARNVVQRQALRRKVGQVFQHPENQVVAQTVADEVAFGLENLNLPADKIQKSVEQTLKHLGMETLAERNTQALSGGQLQRLALAGVLAMDPGYVLLDEPFAWLDAGAQEALRSLLLALCRDGRAVVVVSQETDLLAHVDRAWLMRGGELVADTTPRTLFQTPELFARARLRVPPLWALCGRLGTYFPQLEPCLTVASAARWLAPHAGKVPRPCPQAVRAKPASHGDPALLALKAVAFGYVPEAKNALFRGVDLSLNAGEWLLLGGPSGCGKSSLLQLLNGLLQPTSGTVNWHGRSTRGLRTAQLCHHAGLVFQNPRQQFFADSVFEELGYALREQGQPPATVEKRVRRVCERLNFPQGALRRAPQQLSGGEQLLVALGSLLLLEPELLVLDETLTSLDPVARCHTLELLKRLQGDGLALITVAHRPAPLMTYADRFALMEHGGLTACDATAVPDSWLPDTTRLSEALWGCRMFGSDGVYQALVPEQETTF